MMPHDPPLKTPTPTHRITRAKAIDLAATSGFMLSSEHGQLPHQPMPVSDSFTLERFANAVLAWYEEEQGKGAKK